jgi:predicted MFS family arabinose efflux permease
MAAGGLGAVFAAQPLEAALGVTGWRDVMLALAAVTVAVALAIGWLVPERTEAAHGAGLGDQLAGVRAVMTARAFWRYAPMVTLSIGGFMAVQGLWVSRWMAEVEGFGRALIAQQLTLLNAAFLAGCLFMGFVTTPLLRRGVSEARMLDAVAVAFVLVFAAINALAGGGHGWPWALLAFVYPASNIAYPLLTRALPLALAGRANTALNLAAFIGAFGLQWGMGVLVDALRAAGLSAADSYRATFALLLALQAAAVAWMLLAGRQPGVEGGRSTPASHSR